MEFFDRENEKALLADVKLNPDKISLDDLRFKARKLQRNLRGHHIEYQGLSLQDM